MDESKLNGLSNIPEWLLESIAGGVVDDAQRDTARQFAQYFKDNGSPLDGTLGFWRMYSEGFVDPADQPEYEDIIRSVYES